MCACIYGRHDLQVRSASPHRLAAQPLLLFPQLPSRLTCECSILVRKRTRDEHPLLMVVDDVVDETVTELSREATNTCVQTMVEALMFETHANGRPRPPLSLLRPWTLMWLPAMRVVVHTVWINAAIDPLIREAASEARHEVRVEKMGDWLVGEVVDEMIREAAVSSRREHWRQTRALDKEHQAGLINAAAKRIAHVAALRMMLANLATRGNAVARKVGGSGHGVCHLQWPSRLFVEYCRRRADGCSRV